MKRDFTQENFEDFLKRSADSLRMKAPDKVWQNLSKELNKRRRRFTFGLSVVLLFTAVTGYYLTTDAGTYKAVSLQKPVQQQQAVNTVVPEKSVTAYKTGSAFPSASKNISIAQLNSIEINNSGSFPVNAGDDGLTNGLQDMPANETSAQEKVFNSTIVDSYTEFDPAAIGEQKELKQNEVTSTSLPLTIESVVNSYKAKSKRKIETQIYFTPTISYRKLSENKSYLRSLDPANIPANFPALNSSVSNNVTHKPDVGFELGFTAKYSVSNKLKIRSGLQFNVNRYDVKAFNSPRSIATIALNNGPRVDSFNTISRYSNVPGYKSDWLQNLSFQLSAPIGIEYLFSNNDKVQFGIGTTVQPTYVLGDRAYLITNDYKSYTQVPWLIRRWNVNTAFETFITYNTGKTKWQFGPQVRYQLLSSFVSEYPVKENLFDFGLKVGVSLNK